MVGCVDKIEWKGSHKQNAGEYFLTLSKKTVIHNSENGTHILAGA